MEKRIEVFNLSNLPVAPLDSFFELQEDFKKSDPDKLAKLQMLILTRGFKYSFKVWRDPSNGHLMIIDAHQRRKALLGLRKYGYIIPDIPYEEIQAADKQEAVEEIAAYNSEFAQKNPDTILFQKYHISTDRLETFNLGFELKKNDYDVGAKPLFANEEEKEEIKEDDVPINIPGTGDAVFAKTGDIWLLGENRLMCGDCRSKKDVIALMDGRKADMILTDPPYNVNYEGGNDDKLKIENDSMDNDMFLRFLRSCFEVMFQVLKPGGSFYMFHADSEGENFRRSLRESGFKIAPVAARALPLWLEAWCRSSLEFRQKADYSLELRQAYCKPNTSYHEASSIDGLSHLQLFLSWRYRGGHVLRLRLDNHGLPAN